MIDLAKTIKTAIWGKENTPKWIKWIHQNLSPNHCEECLMLDDCLFSKEKTPKWPHHNFCHCILKDIPYSEVLNSATAESSYSKFDPYLFNTLHTYQHNKEKLFNTWGYSAADATWLQKEMEKQCLQNYLTGNYNIGKLDANGQRISIQMTIPRKDSSENVSFTTGWMVCPNGKIRLLTPYGGKN